MALALRQPTRREESSSRPAPVCRVHTCLRCHTAITSSEPCSFVPSAWRTCLTCAGQEQVLKHLPPSRAPWGAALARTRRA
jgi:hypothetical protein